MDLDIFLEPLNLTQFSIQENTLGACISLYTNSDDFPELNGIDIAIVGVKEDRGSLNNRGCAKGPNEIRAKLYGLYPNFYKNPNIVDLGNINAGEEIKDTYFAVSEVVATLIKRNITVIILGGSQDITFANYQAYEKLEQIVNLVSVDKKFDIDHNSAQINSDNYLNKIILHQPNYLFNFSNLGYQSYFESPQSVDLMTKLHFDMHRLGEINKDKLKEMEPTLRNCDLVSFDIASVRHSDAPGASTSTPNGLYGEEFCQLAWYSGLSDKVSSVGFYEYNPSLDRNEQTAFLISEAIWYFISGFYHRKSEFPSMNPEHFLKFRVIIEEHQHEIVFFKSTLSDRWWMNVPYPDGGDHKYNRQRLVPCSYEDYQKACNEDIPERWWKTFQKLL